MPRLIFRFLALARSTSSLSSSVLSRIALLAALLLAGGGAAPVFATTEHLSATLTVKNIQDITKGCSNFNSGVHCSTSSILTDDDFTLDGTTYHIRSLWVRNDGNALEILFDTDLETAAQSLILEIDGTDFAFENADHKDSDYRQWNSSGLTWSAGDDVAVKLKSPDETAPTFSSAEVTAAAPKLLAITFDEALDTGSVPAATAFTVEVDGTDVGTPTNVSISGAVVTLTLATALDASQSNVTIDYTKPASNPLQDASDNEVANFTGKSVTNNAPACPDTASHPGDAFWTACLTIGESSNTYGFTLGFGDLSETDFTDDNNIPFSIAQLHFSSAGFRFNPAPASSNTVAEYWVLQIGDTTLNLAEATRNPTTGIYTWNPSIITWDDDNIGDKISVSLKQGNRPPVASDATVDMDEDTTYTFSVSDFGYSDEDNDDLASVKIVTLETEGFLQLSAVGVTLDQVISVADITAGNLTFAPGGTDRTGSPFATFTFKVNDGEDDSVAAYTMTINVDSVPDVTDVSVTSTPRSGTANPKDTYGLGEVIQVTVTFDEAVTVDTSSGTPFFRLQIYTTNGFQDRDATYMRGSGTTALEFEYVVVASDRDGNGVSSNANALMLNSGTIRDSDDNNADITHDALGTQSGHKVDGSLEPDTTAPTFSSALVTAAAPKSLAITFSEALDTTSVPAASAFAVIVGTTPEATPTNVSISGAVVTLTLATALDAGQTNVTVNYTNPGTSNNPLKDAANNEVATFITSQSVTNNAPACPTGQPGDAFWTACLTLGADGNWYGLSGSNGALSDTMFTRDGTSYTIDGLRARSTDNRLELSFTVDLRDTVAETWILHVGSEDFKIKDRNDFSGGQNSFLWDSTAITWAAANAGDKVSVSLTQGNRPPTASDATVDMDEDAAYTFSVSDFGYTDADSDPLASVKIVTVETAGDLELSGTDVTANQVIAAVDIGNLVFTPAADWNGSATFTYTVYDGEDDSDSANPATMTINVDPVPDVTQVVVTSTPNSGTADTYGRGEVIQVTVTFDEAVTVTGSPFFQLRISDNTNTINNRDATLLSGSGTTALVFGYTVVAADDDDDGIWIPENALMLNSGTIRNSANNNADVTHAQLGTQSTHKVDGSLDPPDTTAPTFSSALVTAAAPKSLAITFDEPLDTSSEPAASAFTVKVGGTAEGTPTNVSISGAVVTLTLAVALDSSQSNVTVDYTNPGTANSPLKDASDNEVATFTGQTVTNNAPACPTGQPTPNIWQACLTIGGSGNTYGFVRETIGDLSETGLTDVNNIPFSISRLHFSSAGFRFNLLPASSNTVAEYWVLQIGDETLNLADATRNPTTGIYTWNSLIIDWDADNVGDKISVSLTQGNRPPTASDNTVTTDEDEDYTFRPGDFNFGDADTSDILSSVKIVTLETAGDMELNGTDVTENQVISSGDIGDLVFSPAADGNGAPYDSFTFKVNDGEDDSVAAYTMTINVDSVPDVTQVAVTSTPNSGTANTYGRGEVIEVTVTFDEAVTVTGSPFFRLRIRDNTNTINNRDATLLSGSGTTALVFGYTVVAADDDDNGIWIPENALMLNSGTIQDSDSNTADITHTQLGTQSTHLVDGSIDPPDTTAPTFSSALVTAAAPKSLAITFNEALDTTSVPAASAFAVIVGTTPEATPTNVSISGAVVTLTLAVALDSSQSNVTVDYINPGTANSPLKDASDNEVATFTNRAVTNNAPACPTGQPGDAFWTACLTIGRNPLGSFGYGRIGFTGSHLSPNEFTYNGATHSLVWLNYSSLARSLSIRYTANSDLSNSVFTLQVGTTEVGSLSGVDGSQQPTSDTVDFPITDNDLRWDNTNIGDKVSVSLTLANRLPTASDGTINMAEDGSYTFQESDFGFMDDDATDSLVSVKITGVETAGALKLSGTDVSVNDVIAVASIPNLTFEPAADVSGDDYASFTFKVNDGQDDSVADYTMTINVDSVPDVTDVLVTSTPNSGTTDTYGRGEVIEVTVTFDEAVTVTGSPFFRLRISDGSNINNRDATLLSGSGSTELVFGYTVVAADDDDDGIWIPANALMLNSGTIRNSANNNADVTHAQLGTQSSHKVDGSLDVDITPLRITSIERQEPDTSPTNADSLTWRVTFNEDVKNVDAADFTLSGTSATLTISQVTASTVYDVTASAGDLAGLNATATLGFSGSQDIKDTADNALANTTPTGTNDNTYVVDNTRPSVTIAGMPATSSAAFPANFSFSEPVTGFLVGDITVSNGTASSFTEIAPGKMWIALITPAANGLVTVSVAAGVAADEAGNDNVAATPVSSTYTAPVAGVSVSPTSLSVDEGETTTYTVVLNTEPSGTVTVTPSSGDTAAATLSPASLTFSSSNWATAQTVTVSGEEDDDADDEIVTVSHSVSGYVGVTTVADVSVTVTDNDTIDAANPQVTSIERLTPPSSPTNADSLTWRVTFNRDVKNVDAADFTVSSTTATVTVSEVTAATVYDVTASDGDLALLNATVRLGFSDGQDIQDMDDSALITAPTGANETTYVLDNIQPSVTITGVPATSAASFSATFSFSEPVTGFAVEDVIVGNGAASAFSVTTADEVWTALITPTASGTVTVDVAAGVAVDAAGNDNTAATRASSTYTSPSVAPPSDRDPDATRERAVPLPVVNPPQEEPYLHVQGGSLDPATGDVIDYYSFTMTTSQTSQGAVQLQRLAATRNGAFPLNNAQQVDIQVEVKEGQNTGLTVTLEDDKANNLQMVSLEAGQRSVQIEASLEPGTYYIKVQIQEEVTDSTPTPSAPVEYDLSLSLEPPSPPAGAVTDAQVEEVATAFNPWLARFGRTVTDQVLETVKQRLQPGRQEGAQVRIAGQDIPLAIAPYIGAPADQEEQPVLQSWLLSWRPSPQDWVTGSSFALTTNPDPGASDGGYLSFWGQGAMAGFDGRQDQLSLEGQVTTTLVGADWVTGQWTAGVTLGRSTGAGDYRQSDCAAADPCSIAVETTLTGVYPYLGGVQLGDHVEAWAAAGYGRGDLTLRPDDDKALSTDLTVTMGAAGLHSQLLQPANGDGFSVAFKGDARFTRATSEAVNRAEGNLAAAEADVWLIRAGIEAARPMAVGAAATFIPSFEVGVRLDGGDADTGFGTDIGAGLAFSSPQKGLRLDLKARGLMAHEAAGFQEWGAAASLTWEPQPDSEHGLSAGLTQSWGASPSGGMEALLQRRSMAELAATDGNGEAVRFVAAGRLEAELGYGLPLWDGAFTMTPNIGFAFSETVRDYRIGWKFSPASQGNTTAPRQLELELDATRSETTGGDGSAEHGVMLRSMFLW